MPSSYDYLDPINTGRRQFNLYQSPTGAGQTTPPKEPTSGFEDLTALIGSFSAGEKGNRYLRGTWQQAYDQMMMEQERDRNTAGQLAHTAFGDQTLRALAERRTGEDDAFQKLLQSSYVASGGSDYRPATVSILGQSRTLPNFPGVAPRASTPEEIEGATTLRTSMLDRLKSPAFMPAKFEPSYTYEAAPLSSYSQPGRAENISSYLGAGTGVLGALDRFGVLDRIFGRGGGVAGDVAGVAGRLGGGASTISSLSGALSSYGLPASGAAAGIYGMAQNRGALSNIGSGAATGASIGTMIAPGIGTAIGAGAGALAGGIQSLFSGGPSKEEQAGRELAAQGRQAITAAASPQDIQEAQVSGWEDPQDALFYIILRNRLGTNEDAVYKQLHQAEERGPEAVQQVLTQILQGASRARV